MAEIVHVPVMLDEVLSLLVPPRPDSLMLDCTLGEGGHAEAFLSRYPALRYAGVDADPRIQAKAKERLKPFAGRVAFLSGYYDEVLADWVAGRLAQAEAEIGPASEKEMEPRLVASDRPDLVLFDLGISMHHYVEAGRGFGFGKDEPLDMRLSPFAPRSAADIVNEEREEELARIIYLYGEERYSRRIARTLVEARRSGRIQDSGRLAELVKSAVPGEYRHGRIHPATRTFQALRIAVNDELGRAERGIGLAASLLAEGGILCVISFHSLEDRISKTLLRGLSGRGPEAEKIMEAASECEKKASGGHAASRASSTKEKKTPIIGISRPEPCFELVVKKALEPSPEETARNPASRSAKLRAVRKIASGAGKAMP